MTRILLIQYVATSVLGHFGPQSVGHFGPICTSNLVVGDFGPLWFWSSVTHRDCCRCERHNRTTYSVADRCKGIKTEGRS